MIPCFNRAGMMHMVSWYAGEQIFASIAAGLCIGADYQAAARKTPRKTGQDALDDFCAGVRARQTQKG